MASNVLGIIFLSISWKDDAKEGLNAPFCPFRASVRMFACRASKASNGLDQTACMQKTSKQT